MSPQTSVNVFPDKARPGGLVDNRAKNVESRVASGIVEFGLAVARVTDDNTVRVVTGAGDVAAGILQGAALSSHFLESQQGGSDPESYKDEDMVNTLSMGALWVQVEDTPAVGDDVFVRHTNGIPGAFRTDNAGGEAVEITNARWLGAADAGLSLAPLQINLP